MFNLPKKILANGMLQWQQRKPAPSFDPTTITSVLFIEMTRLGDIVAMLPALQSFHTYFPNAELSVAVDISHGKLFDIVPSIKNVFAFEKTQRPGSFFAARNQLSYRKFDLICSMSPSARNSLLTLSTPSLYKIGYFDIHDSMTPFLHHSRVESIGLRLISDEHYFMENMYERAGKICLALGIPYNAGISVKIPDTLQSRVLDTLNRHGYKKGQPLIVVHPFAGWSFREWSLSRFATFAREMTQSEDGGSAWIVFVGTKQESFVLFQLRQELSNIQRALFMDDLSVGELAALIAQATLFVGNDSGPLHLASALGIPTVGLFGPASPSLTGTQTEQTTALFHQVECSPCNQLTCVRPDNSCMQLITTSEVLQAARQALAS